MDHLASVKKRKKNLNSFHIQLHIELYAIFGARTFIGLSSSGRGAPDLINSQQRMESKRPVYQCHPLLHGICPGALALPREIFPLCRNMHPSQGIWWLQVQHICGSSRLHKVCFAQTPPPLQSLAPYECLTWKKTRQAWLRWTCNSCLLWDL